MYLPDNDPNGRAQEFAREAYQWMYEEGLEPIPHTTHFTPKAAPQEPRKEAPQVNEFIEGAKKILLARKAAWKRPC